MRLKFIHNIIVSIFCISVFCGCEGMADSDSGLVSLDLRSVYVTNDSETRATIVEGTQLPATDAQNPHRFGMFVYNSGTDVPQIAGYDEIEAVATVPSTSVINWRYNWKEGTSPMTNDRLSIVKGRAADIYMYHPYTAGQKDHTAIEFTTDEQKDWLVTPPLKFTAEQTKSNISASINFSHLMTCIEIRLKNDYPGTVTLNSITLTDESAVMSGSDVISSRLCSGGTFNLEESDITRAITGKTLTDAITIDENIDISDTGRSIYFIMPQIDSYTDGKLCLSFVINGKNTATKFHIPTEGITDGFRQGVKYMYTLTIDNTMKFNPTGRETDWTISTAYLEHVL